VVADGLGAVEPDGGGVVDRDLEDVFLQTRRESVCSFCRSTQIRVPSMAGETHVLAGRGREEARVEAARGLGLARLCKVGSNNGVVNGVVMEL
jgi:hypothetical protein